MKPKPLKSKTMTLEQLQERTLKVLKQCREQFNRAHYEDGLSDKEFVDEVIDAFEWQLKSDMAVLKMHKSNHPSTTNSNGRG